jgi:putative transposase
VRRRLQVWLYATWGVEHHSLVWIRETYRRRFGIETSYRQLNQARIRTSSRSPELRLCYVGLALMLRNVWAWLHWEVLSQKRRGQRLVGTARLTLDEVLQWLEQVSGDWLGRRDALETERPWPKQERA